MKVLGTVKDAATEVPLLGAKIKLYVREEELAVLQSDSEGKFRHESESQYLGEILICKVEKAGYEPQKVIQEFEADEVQLEIKLVPKKDEKIEFTVNLKDEKRTPLKGVNISLELDGEGVGVGISDKDGIFKISLSPDFEGKTINYEAELAGFELASGAVLLKKETSVKITMKTLSVPPPNRKWLKIAAGAAGIVAVILAVMILLPPHEPEMPEIKYFVASQGMIGPGDSSKLSWIVSDATHVNIEPGIGRVNSKGEKRVFPTESTTYTITATNEAGKDVDTTTVKVDVVVLSEKPVINSFRVSQSKAGEYSTLSWSVSDASSVTIDPGIGKVALTGTRQASPTETTIYTLTATNDAGRVDTTVEVLVEEEVNLPVINYFEANPNKISAGDNSELSWRVSGATSVTIDPEGDVALTGSMPVSPTESTIYTLTATNDAGNRFDTVKVIVKPKEMPVINVADRLDFKEVQLDETDEEDLTIENKGQATLEVEKMTVDDYHFTIRGRTRFSIPPNDHEKLIVSFKPDAVGPQTGKLTITSNDPEHQIATVELRGSGAGGDKPDLTIYIDDAPSTAHPGQDISGTFKVKVKNQGGADARNFLIDLVLSEDQDVPIESATYSVNFHDDVLLRGGRTHIDILSPGKTADISARLYGTIPSDTPTGTYWLGVVVDPGKDVDEIREDNNAGISRLEVVIFAPTQLSPADGSVFDHYPRTTTLKWTAVPGATSYTVEIDCYHCCQSGKWCTDVGKTYNLVPDIKATSYTFDFVGAQPGRWRVWAVDAIGQESPKTGWWEFRYTR